jgi:hypothetical protein
MTRIFVDFNALYPNGEIIASSRFAKGPAPVGATVLLQDLEGNSVEGEVRGVCKSKARGIKLLTIKPDMETWKAEDDGADLGGF